MISIQGATHFYGSISASLSARRRRVTFSSENVFPVRTLGLNLGQFDWRTPCQSGFLTYSPPLLLFSFLQRESSPPAPLGGGKKKKKNQPSPKNRKGCSSCFLAACHPPLFLPHSGDPHVLPTTFLSISISLFLTAALPARLFFFRLPSRSPLAKDPLQSGYTEPLSPLHRAFSQTHPLFSHVLHSPPLLQRWIPRRVCHHSQLLPAFETELAGVFKSAFVIITRPQNM